jgi:hypothetical protein
MSVLNPSVIDGVGIEVGTDKVVMQISDHLSWDDPEHIPNLTRKIEAYASAALSGHLTENYAAFEGKPVLIRLICRVLPDEGALRFLTSIEGQLRSAGLEFEHIMLPHDY